MAALRKYYSADANAVDYAGGAEKLEAARAFINEYVSDHTNQMIPELLVQGILDPLTRLVLINTVYFKGAICIVNAVVASNQFSILTITFSNRQLEQPV